MIEFGDITERVMSEMDKVFPGGDRMRLSWEPVKMLRRHVLVAAHRNVADGLGYTRFLALDLSGECLHLGGPRDQTSTQGLLVLLQKEEIEVEKGNCAEIVKLFELMHPQKRILDSADDLEQQGAVVREEKESRLGTHANVIQPCVFTSQDQVRGLRFWAIDYWTGDLEQWDIVEDNRGEMQIEMAVLEHHLIVTLKP
jgi:hypothetical protein